MWDALLAHDETVCKKRSKLPFYEPEPQAVTVPYHYISPATILQTRQENHIQTTFIQSMYTTYNQSQDNGGGQLGSLHYTAG